MEKLGTGGALLAALACPVCFPKFALVGAALGLGVLAPFEGYTALAVQGLFVLAYVGQVLAFRRHRNRWLLAFATGVTALLFAGFYAVPSSIVLQFALLGLVISSGWLILVLRRCATCRPTTGARDQGSTNWGRDVHRPDGSGMTVLQSNADGERKR